jgi:serine/threonine protein kinase
LLLRGKLPFDSSNKQEVIEKTKAGVIDFSGDLWNIVSAGARDFITKCLQVDPEKRCSVDTALAHPWIVNAVDPYPELTARETMRHQQHLLEVQLHHQQELLAQLHCTCPPHTQLSRSQSAPNSNTRSSSPPASQMQANGNSDVTIAPVSFAEVCLFIFLDLIFSIVHCEV